MRIACALAAALIAATGAVQAGTATTEAAETATLRASIDISDQLMTVTHNGFVVGEWPVSTARRGKITPRGQFTAEYLSRHHKSSRYDGAPMPYSIFFKGHYAIHGTDQISRLGRPASAGCIRLHPENAAVLFSLVKAEGMDKMLVEVVEVVE